LACGGPAPIAADSRYAPTSTISENDCDMSEEEPRSASGSGAAPALLVDHLTKRFGDRTAVEDVSFEVGRGDVFAFLGPNGAGKTTTVRMLGTVIEPSSGSAAIGRPSPLSCRRGAGRGATTKNMTTWLPAVLIGLVLGYGTTFLRETGLVIAALVTLGLAAVYVLPGSASGRWSSANCRGPLPDDGGRVGTLGRRNTVRYGGWA